MSYDPARDPFRPAGAGRHHPRGILEPEILGDDAPIFAHDWLDLRDHAEASLARRRTAYPELVTRGVMTAEDAATDLAAWIDLAQEWRWIVSAEGEPPHPSTLPGRRNALDLAMQRIEAEMSRGNRTGLIHAQYHAIEAMQWHLQKMRGDEPMIHKLSRINHHLRDAQKARFCHACDRWRTDPATRACTSTNCGLALREAA